MAKLEKKRISVSLSAEFEEDAKILKRIKSERNQSATIRKLVLIGIAAEAAEAETVA